MRKTDWAIAIATAAYSYLFYEQNAGLNFFLYTLLILGLLIWTHPGKVKQRTWLFAACLNLISAFFILLHGSTLAIFANVVSLLVLAASTVSAGSSVIVNLFQAVFSIAGSVFYIRNNTVNKSHTERQKPGMLHVMLTYFLPLLAGTLFFVLYRTANPLFENYTRKINLNFISFPWLFFTLSGLLIASGLLQHRRVAGLDAWESRQMAVQVPPSPARNWNPVRAFLILLVLLNLMLLFINSLDFNYLYLGAGMPEGITHKQFVHHGVGLLILSIILGVSAILYFLPRAEGSRESAAVKFLVFAWILQNLVMVVSTALRNDLYIREALLTYKRIGVYYWLLLSGIGLITVLFRLARRKPDWILFRINPLMALVILVLSAGIDWDQHISNYNIIKIRHIAGLDKKYLISLSEGNMAQLFRLKQHPAFNTDSVYHYQYARKYRNTAALDRKLLQFIENNESTDWRSFNFRRKKVQDYLAAPGRQGLYEFDLSLVTITGFPYHSIFDQVRILRLSDKTQLSTTLCSDLNRLKGLEVLCLPTLRSSDLPHLNRMKRLKKLRLDGATGHIAEKIKKDLPWLTLECVPQPET